MPELPELETITTQLDKVLVNKTVTSVKILRKTSFIGNQKLLENKKISQVSRRAKMAIISFKNFDQILLIHLKMTGQLVWQGETRVAGGHPTSDFVNTLPSSHTRVMINFSDNSQLFFNDQRAFGWLKILSLDDWQKLSHKFPPDVIDPGFTVDFFKKILQNSRRPIKIIILDQAKMGGVGNIYANDALLLAKINPKLAANKLNLNQVKNLRKAIIVVIKKGIKYGGASYSHYIDSSGKGGSYQKHFLAYQQDNKLCPQCKKEKIKKINLGGRGTYYCPNCQK